MDKSGISRVSNLNACESIWYCENHSGFIDGWQSHPIAKARLLKGAWSLWKCHSGQVLNLRFCWKRPVLDASLGVSSARLFPPTMSIKISSYCPFSQPKRLSINPAAHLLCNTAVSPSASRGDAVEGDRDAHWKGSWLKRWRRRNWLANLVWERSWGPPWHQG